MAITPHTHKLQEMLTYAYPFTCQWPLYVSNRLEWFDVKRKCGSHPCPLCHLGVCCCLSHMLKFHWNVELYAQLHIQMHIQYIHYTHTQQMDRNKRMSPPLAFLLISPLPHGSIHFLQCHFEWRWTPKFVLTTYLQSSLPPPLLKGSVPSASATALLLTEEKVKRLHWQLNIRQTAKSDWVPHGALTRCTTLLYTLFEGTASACLQSLTLPVANCAQLVSFLRGIQFSAIMRPGLQLNPGIAMTSEKLV